MLLWLPAQIIWMCGQGNATHPTHTQYVVLSPTRNHWLKSRYTQMNWLICMWRWDQLAQVIWRETETALSTQHVTGTNAALSLEGLFLVQPKMKENRFSRMSRLIRIWQWDEHAQITERGGLCACFSTCRFRRFTEAYFSFCCLRP